MTNLFERFFIISSDLLKVTDREGKIIHASRRWKDVLGYDPTEVEGKQIYDYFHPDDVIRSRDARDILLQEGLYKNFDNRCVHKNGSLVWMRWRGTVDPENGFFYASGVDVTKQKIEEGFSVTSPSETGVPGASPKQDRERSTILRQLVETAKDGFGYCDSEFKAIYLNRFLVDELGWSLGPKRILDFVSPATRLLYDQEIIPTLIKHNDPWEGEVEFINIRTGELIPLWQRIFRSTAADGISQYIAFFATDLRTKRRAEAALVHNSKMASLGQMAAGIAHEVNNPITIIHGTAGLLKKAIQTKSPDPEKIIHGLERIEKTALRISRIVKGLRMFSRSGETDPAIPTALSEILEETLDLCRERFRDHAVDLRIEKVPDISIRCRPTQISQVLLNLLNNSFDAISKEDERWIHIEFVVKENRVRVSIIDSGPELSEGVQARLMEPFFTTKEPGKGTGLGLPVSRGIVEEHAGKLLYVHEAPNTCFAIDLPCTPGNPSRP